MSLTRPTRYPLRAEVPTVAAVQALAAAVDALETTVPPHTHLTTQISGLNAVIDARVDSRVQLLTGAAPAALDTLAELAAALDDDADFAGTVTTALAGKQPLHATLTGLAGLTLAPDTVLVRTDAGFALRSFEQFKADLGLSDGGTPTTLFDVEAHGAVADDTTDCYPAFVAAWTAMLAFATGGVLYGRSVGTYRVVLDADRVHTWPGAQYAAFPIPMLPRTGPKLAYGLKGVGEAYTVRAAELGGTPGQVATGTVFRFEYDPTDFAWSPTDGLPSVFGCADADMTDPSGNTFSHVHFTIDDVILRNTANPSLCLVNAEQCSTVRIGRARFDVDVVLDSIPEPTHPTGAAFLLPRSNNNVAIQVDSVVVEGHYAGVPLTEHVELRSAIVLRCKAAVFTRRPNSHPGHVGRLKVEQCPYGFTGWDPAVGVVGFHGWSGVVGSVGFEDYAYQGTVPWIYAPTAGAHLNDPAGTFTGEIGFCKRVNSEPADPGGIGIGPGGGSYSLYVIGPGGTTASPVAIYGPHHGQPATRLSPPIGPVLTSYRLHSGESGPAATPTEGSAINVGVKFKVTDATAEATRIWFWRQSTDVNPTGGRLWKHTAPSTWEALGDVAFAPGSTTGEWIPGDLPAPVALEAMADAPDVTYVAVVNFPGNFPFFASYWDSGPGGSGLVVGPLRAYNNVDAGGQACFSMGAITVPPTTSGGGTDYGIDVTVTTEE